MNAIIIAIALMISSTFSACVTQSAQEQPVGERPVITMQKGEKRPVLVELFTSEGCSSCPPADKVLMTLQRDQLVPDVDVITLGFHVDYWDRLGWKDRFSSAEFTRRQEAYARQLRIDSSYTPQIVVDGTVEFVGSNWAKANDVIAKRAFSAKGIVDLTIDGGTLNAAVSSLDIHGNATAYLAVAESGLSNRVSSGENSGSTLEHASVVRELRKIGNINSKQAGGSFQIQLPVNGDWKAENVRYVVFVQDDATLKILAVAQVVR